MLTDNDGNLLKPGRSPSLPSDTPPLERPHLLILSKYFHQRGTNILIYEGCAHSNHHTLSSETSVDTLRASLHVSSSSSPPLSGSANVYLQCAGSMACRNPMWVNFHSPWWQAAYSWDKNASQWTFQLNSFTPLFVTGQHTTDYISQNSLTPGVMFGWVLANDLQVETPGVTTQWIGYGLKPGCDFSCWFLTGSLGIHFDYWSCVGYREQLSGSQMSCLSEMRF